MFWFLFLKRLIDEVKSKYVSDWKQYEDFSDENKEIMEEVLIEFEKMQP